jgi:DNA-binding transcriptional LysR family regulator
MNYRPDDLRALIALRDLGSFVRAAERMHITQSAFSRRIAQLEQTVGGPLVVRTTRRAALTALGQALADQADHVLRQLDDSVLDAARHARGEAGRLSVACLTTVAHTVLPAVLHDFRARYPQLRLNLRDDTGQRVAQAVLAREAEFGVGMLGTGTQELAVEHCADDPYVIAFAPGHPLERRRRVGWDELNQWRVVMLRSSSANRQQVDAALAERGLPPPWFDEVEHLSSMLGLLRGGVGIGVLPRLALSAGGGETLRTRPLGSPPVVRRIGLMRRHDSVLGTPATELWDLLRRHLGALQRRAA